MKIAVLAPYSRPWDDQEVEGSGMNVFIKESVEALVSAGHSVTVYIRRSREGDLNSYQISSGLTVVTVPAGEARRLGRVATYQACQQKSFPVEMLSEVEVVMAHYWVSEAWVSQIVAKFSKPVFYFSHSFYLNSQRVAPVDRHHLLAEVKLGRLSTWCAYSQMEYQQMKSVLGAEKVVLLYPGVTVPEYFTEVSPVKKDQVVFVGRKNKAKGYDLFTKLAKLFPQVSFLGVGRSEKSFSNKLPNLEEVPFVAYQQVLNIIKQAKLVVCPSRYEHFGLVPLIANNLETPVLASNSGGFPDVVRAGKTGNLFEGSFRDLSQVFQANHLDRDFDYDFKSAQKIKEKYSWQNFVKEFVDLSQRSEVLFKGQVLSVKRTPRVFNKTPVLYEQVCFSGSVHVIPVDSQGNYLFIKERRLEDPKLVKVRVLSGIIDSEEDPLVAAKRELREELGITAQKFKLIATHQSKGTIQDKRFYYLATDLSYQAADHQAGEDIKGYLKLNKEQLSDRVKSGGFGFSLSSLVILKVCGILKSI